MKNEKKINGLQLGKIWVEAAEAVSSKAWDAIEIKHRQQVAANRRMVSYGMAIVKKPYPKRLDLSEFIERIIWNHDAQRIGAIEATGMIVKYIQNNYRRRRKIS